MTLEEIGSLLGITGNACAKSRKRRWRASATSREPERLESFLFLGLGRVTFRPMAASSLVRHLHRCRPPRGRQRGESSQQRGGSALRLKGSKASIAFERVKAVLTLVADETSRMKALFDVLQSKLIKRNGR